MSPLNVKSMIPFALYSGFSSVSCKTFRFTMLMASSFPFLHSAATAPNQQGFHLNRTLLQPHPSSPSSSHGSSIDLNTPEPHTTYTLLILKLCLIVIERIICGIMSEYVLTFAVKFRSRTLHLLLAATAPLESTRERERGKP